MDMTNMEMHGPAYIAYVSGIILQRIDPDFDVSALDDMYEEKVLPWVQEFCSTYEYKDNIYNEPFMECLERFLDAKLNPKKEFEVVLTNNVKVKIL